MANYKRSKGQLKDLTWKNFHVHIARRMNFSEGEEYQKKIDDIYNMLVILADMFWEEHQEICHATTFTEIKKEIENLSQTMDKKSLLFMLICQGAKQFMYPTCLRGRGIGMRRPRSEREEPNANHTSETRKD